MMPRRNSSTSGNTSAASTSTAPARRVLPLARGFIAEPLHQKGSVVLTTAWASLAESHSTVADN